MPPEVESKTIAECLRFKEPIPDKILNKPNLFLGLALYLNAWFELDTERAEALAPIKRSSIFEYARDYELSEEQTDDLLYYINSMDTAHLKRERAKVKPPRPRGIKRIFEKR